MGTRQVWGKAGGSAANRFRVVSGLLARLAQADGVRPCREIVWLPTIRGDMAREGKTVAWHDKKPVP